MRAYEVEVDEDGNVTLYVGDTKGGLTLIMIESEWKMPPWQAREMGEALIEAAEEAKRGE